MRAMKPGDGRFFASFLGGVRGARREKNQDNCGRRNETDAFVEEKAR